MARAELERRDPIPQERQREAIPPGVRRLGEHINNVINPSEDLRRGQREAIFAISKHLLSDERKGFIHHPTGYGKTRVMTEVSLGFGGRQVFITPGIHLINQTKEALIARNPEADIGLVGGGNKDFGHEITIITPNSLRSLLRRWVRHGNQEAAHLLASFMGADLVFIDEVHHFLTPKRQELLWLFKDAVQIGATATDKYTQEKSVENKFGPKIHEVSIEVAIEEGVLTQVRGFTVKTGETLDMVGSLPRAHGKDFNTVQLERQLNLEARDRLALDAYKKLLWAEGGRPRPAIAFCISRRHAWDFARRAREAGIGAEFITGEMKVVERQALWERFERGEFQVLAAVDLLNESLDKPWIEVGINLRPTMSHVLARQRLGRLLRPSPQTGKQFAYVIELVDDKTQLRTKRPVTVFDLFGVRRFRNGEVLTKSNNNQRSRSNTHSDQEVDLLLDGIPIEAELQELPVFGGILDRLSMVRTGELEESEVEKLKNEMRALLTSREYSEEELMRLAVNEFPFLRFWLGEQEISGYSLVSNFFGKKNYHGIPLRKDLSDFLAFVFGDKSYTGTEILCSFIDPEFEELLYRNARGELDEPSRIQLGHVLRDIFEKTRRQLEQQGFSLNWDTLSMYWAVGIRVEHEKFNGIISTLMRRFEGKKSKEYYPTRMALERILQFAYPEKFPDRQ